MRQDEPWPVVILNMHYSGLGIARNLSGSGADVHGLSFDPTFFGNYTKYCRFLLSPDTERQPEPARDFLLELAATLPRKPILLPTRDHDIEFILRFRSELERAFVIPYPSSEILERVLDKDRLFEVARQLDIYCPRDWIVRSSAELRQLRGEVEFPCIVKPVRAAQWRKREIWKIVRQKAIVVEGHRELEELYRTLENHDPLVHLQEYISGPETHLRIFGSYRASSTEALRYFTARKLIQYPAGTGTGIVLEATPIPEIVEPSRRLLQHLDYFGISELEYKYHEGRGVNALIEMNPRHWDQHPLGAACGVNLSSALYSDLVRGVLPEATQGSEPVAWIADDGYIRSFVSNLKHREYPHAAFIEVLAGKKSFAVFAVRDPLPVLQLIRSKLGRWIPGAGGS